MIPQPTLSVIGPSGQSNDGDHRMGTRNRRVKSRVELVKTLILHHLDLQCVSEVYKLLLVAGAGIYLLHSRW